MVEFERILRDRGYRLTNQRRVIVRELEGERHLSAEEIYDRVSRRHLGIRKEKVWFQSLPQGEMAVVYWEGNDPRTALQEFASSEALSTSGSRSEGERSTTSSPPRR